VRRRAADLPRNELRGSYCTPEACADWTVSDGSWAKTPSVVIRPVRSISLRRMIRSGAVVFVPMLLTTTFCGMYEPVRTTYFVGFSLDTTTIRFGFWEPFELGGSAATADTNPSAHSIPKAALFVTFIQQFPTISGQRKLARLSRSGTFYDGGAGIPAFGLSVIVNCSRLPVRSDASSAERRLTDLLLPMCSPR